MALFADPAQLQAFQQAGYTHGEFTRASAPELEVDESEWTGKIGIDYRFDDQWLVYANASRGYRSGSFNGGIYYQERAVNDGAYAAPEFIEAFEIGFKADLFNNRVRLNAAAFSYDYTDQQFINVVGISNTLENAGSSSILGVEAELWAQINSKMLFTAGIGLLETEYTELSLVNTQTILDTEDEIDLSGNELISSPALNFNMSIDYDILETQAGYLSTNLNANYQDDQYFSAYNDDLDYGEIRQEAYWLVNARLGWFANDGRYNVSLWGKNIFDKEYNVYALNLQSGFGFDEYLSGEPRTLGLELTVNF